MPSQFPQRMLIDRSAFPAKIRLPDVLSYVSKAFALKINPHWREVEAESYAWFDSYSVHSGAKRQKFFNNNFSLITALTYADADFDCLRTAMDFVLWLFAFDDMTDELDGDFRNSVQGVKQAVAITMNVLRNPDAPPPKLKIAATLHSWFNRMRLKAAPGTIRRFIEATELYTQAILQQTVNRSTDQVPTVDEFLVLRKNTSSLKMVFIFLEYTLKLDFPDKVINDPVFSELIDIGNDLTTWPNDIYSFPVEQAQGDTQNLVFIAMLDKRISLESSMDFVDQLMRRRVKDFSETKARLRSFGPELDDKVALYIQGIEYWVRGSIHWIFKTPRFFGADAERVGETLIAELKVPSDLPKRVKA